MDRQRMYAAREFLRQRCIDHAVALDPALPLERLRYDIDSEVGFSLRPAAGMARVLVRFILHVEAHGRECCAKLLRNAILGFHAVRIRLS